MHILKKKERENDKLPCYSSNRFKCKNMKISMLVIKITRKFPRVTLTAENGNITAFGKSRDKTENLFFENGNWP